MYVPATLPPNLQHLPRAQARLCLSVEHFLLEQLEQASALPAPAQQYPLRGACLLVGCSGGADSTALLLILHYLAPRLGCTVAAMHVDHSLRAESIQEAEFVKKICQKLGRRFFYERRDIKTEATEQHCGTEEVGRRARYAFFAHTASTISQPWICTGHQAGDLQEDILMRLLRGTGWPALGGMVAVDISRRLIRPLLVTSKDTLTNFLQDIGCPWCEDSSNTSHAFTRNRVRHMILPYLQQENPALHESCSDLWRLARIDQEYWNSILPPLPPLHNGIMFLCRTVLSALHKAVRLRLYKKVLDSLGAGQVLQASLLNLETAWYANIGGKRVQFPGRKEAQITKGGIAFYIPHHTSDGLLIDSTYVSQYDFVK